MVNFIVMDALTIYNDIIRRLTLHNVKVVIAPYLLEVQSNFDDGDIGKLCGDQRTARKWTWSAPSH